MCRQALKQALTPLNCPMVCRRLQASLSLWGEPQTLHDFVPCSRPSFFGGFVSTRQASALPTWKPSKPAEGFSARPSSGHSGPPKPAAKSAQPKAAPAPPPDPAIVRKERLKANRNFDSDSDSEADKQRSRESHTLSKLEQRIAAAEQETAAKRPAPKPQHALLQQQQQLTYKSPHSVSGKAAVSKGRIVLPKGKAGAASRNMALAPQVSPLSHSVECSLETRHKL